MRLNEAFETHKDAVDFFCIYIEEAHPSDGWAVFENIDAGIEYRQPATIEERADIAEICALKLDIKMPMLLGDIGNRVDADYAALPVRIFVIGADGIIRYRTGMGPRDLDMDAAMAAIGELAEG